MSGDCLRYTVNTLFGIGLFLNAVLFIPQAIKIFKCKNAKELSLLTFIGFNIIQFFSVCHGFLVKDYILMIGFLLSLITGGMVTVLIIIYRNK
jgi:MtN3 and saliva related transmembrane protein